MSIEIKKSIKPVLYKKALEILERKVENLHNGIWKELIWFLEHESIFTSGIISAGKADAFVYRANGNLLGKVSAAGTTSVDVTKATPDLVEDNEELFQISTDTLPESANNHLKIKLNKGTFLNRRRG